MAILLGYLASGLICLCFICYVFLILIGRTKKVTSSNGFDITKDVLHEYNSINIILNRGYFTVYNIKRRVIRLAKKCYYGNTLSDISIPLIEAGISFVHDRKNRFIMFIRNVIPNLKLLYILPLIAILINSQTYNISDAKVSIIFFSFFAIIGYMVIDIKGNGLLLIQDYINKIKEINGANREKIIGFMNKVNILDKIIFISELIMIIRAVMIILDM